MFYIKNILWSIQFVPPYDDNLKKINGEYAAGACDASVNTIYINNTLKGDFLKKVICHEITHAAMFTYNVSLSYQQEEILADIIATYGEEIITVINKVFKKLKERY